jgi:hypothetical protein
VLALGLIPGQNKEASFLFFSYFVLGVAVTAIKD